jgi:EAL domain-containing protein (putative c-di-GMP-specific phosphodiesterase class I)
VIKGSPPRADEPGVTIERGAVLDSAEVEISTILREERLSSVYQPIMDLERMVPVGVEALVRGPSDSPLATPAQLFATARRVNKVGLLDWACRRSAIVGALDAGLRAPASLFVNAEPEGLATPVAPGFDPTAEALADLGVTVVLEVTERSLTASPAELLHNVDRVRESGWRIAVDDVGADRASLALLPLLAPDIIKLDLRLLAQRTPEDVAEIVNAVLAQCGRSGAVVLAEGVETAGHLTLARSLGATLGQGWYLGRPGPLETDRAYAHLELETAPVIAAPETPWGVVTDERSIRTADRRQLLSMAMTLEQQAMSAGAASVVIGAFQHESSFTATAGRRYADIGARAAFVAVLGKDMPASPADGVRGVALAASDPLVYEWDVAVVGPHFAGALIAKETLGSNPLDPRFDYVLTYDREHALAAARSLLGRVPVPVTRPA